MAEKINENITLHYVPMKKLKTSTIGVFIHRDLNEEDAAKNALLPYVLKRGCALAPDSEALERKLDDLYGAGVRCGTLKKGLDHVIFFTLESISEQYAPESEMLFEELTRLCMSLVFEPVTENGGFKQSIMEQEKKNAIQRIDSVKNDKRSYASVRCIQEMCKGERFAVPSHGTVEGVNAIDGKILYAYYQDIIVSSPMDIYVCGDCDIQKVCSIIKKSTENKIFRSGKISEAHVFRGNETVQTCEESMDVTQGKLSMGFTTGISAADEEYFALMVANSIFGGGAHSKLFNNVREKLSLCYYASSSVERYMGIMMVNAGIEFENYQKAYDEIMAQLEAVKRGEIEELEYTSSINALVTGLKACKDDQYAMQSFYLSEKIAGTNRNLDELIDKISKVTVEDAVRAAQNIRLDTVYFLKGAEA